MGYGHRVLVRVAGVRQAVRVSDSALQMIRHHEGVRLKPYLCPAGLWTVGVGHVLYPEQARLPFVDRKAYPLKPEDNRVWSEVDDLLSADLVRFENGVTRYCPAAANRQGHFDALVSFSFNLGLGTLQRSTLRAKYNRGDYEGAAKEFSKFVKGGGRILPGLVKRRRDEFLVFSQ